MSRKLFIASFLLLLLLIPQIAGAVPLNSEPPPPTLSPQPPNPEISDMRFATHTDAVTGASQLRLVIDVTGPVQTSASLSSSPASCLTVAIKGASVGKQVSSLALDGLIANDISASSVDSSNSKLVINLPVIISDLDYRIFTLPSDAAANKPFRIVIDIDKPMPLPAFNFTPGLKDKIIAIDPGHGGSDSGAIGPNTTQEKAVTLAVALRVKDLLEKAGAKVIMTRLDDRDVYAPDDSAVDELNARAMVGNNNKADIFLDIHADAFTNPKTGGTATYYYKKSVYDRLLAQSIQNSVVSTDNLSDRGSPPANFYVLKHTQMPAALIELAFISNPDEEKLLTSSQFQQILAQGIFNGLDNFFIQAAKLGSGS